MDAMLADTKELTRSSGFSVMSGVTVVTVASVMVAKFREKKKTCLFRGKKGIILLVPSYVGFGLDDFFLFLPETWT